MNFALQKIRESRYRVDEETLPNMRAAVTAAQEAGGERDFALTLFGAGFCLLWRGDLSGAEEAIKASLARTRAPFTAPSATKVLLRAGGRRGSRTPDLMRVMHAL